MADRSNYSLLRLIPLLVLVYLIFPLLYIFLVPANLSWGSGGLSWVVLKLNAAYAPLKKLDDKTGGYMGRILESQAGDCCKQSICYGRIKSFDFQGVQVSCKKESKTDKTE